MSEAPPTEPAPEPAPVPPPDAAPAPSAPAQARTFVAEAARRRGLVVALLFGALLAIQLYSFTSSPRNFTTYFGLGLCAALVMYSLTPVVWPPRVQVSPETFEVVGPPRLRAALENVDTVVYDGEGMGVIFVDLDEVEVEDEGARAKLKQNESEGRPHAQVPGLSFAEVEEVRQLLGEEPPSADEQAGRVEAFYRAQASRPRPVVTYGLITINVAVAVGMWMLGVSPFLPVLKDLVRCGADFAPFTLNGEWWRLFTGMFVHVGLLHLAVNLWLLYDLGSLLERLLGPVVFAVLYLACGVAGGLAAVAFGSTALSAGDSGAILGLAGALAVLVFLPGRRVPRQVFRPMQISALAFAALNIVYAFLVPGVGPVALGGGEMAVGGGVVALGGGAVAGLLAGLILSRPRGQALALAVAGCAALAVAAVLLPRPPEDYGRFVLAY
jgi:rhomboid protease GluP